MKQLAINGTIINEPKVLKLSPLLLYVKIEDDAGNMINCLIHRHGLNFLYQATTDSQVAMYGHYNSRKHKFTVIAQVA